MAKCWCNGYGESCIVIVILSELGCNLGFHAIFFSFWMLRSSISTVISILAPFFNISPTTFAFEFPLARISLAFRIWSRDPLAIRCLRLSISRWLDLYLGADRVSHFDLPLKFIDTGRFNFLENYEINPYFWILHVLLQDTVLRDRSGIYYGDTGRTLRDSRRFNGGACGRDLSSPRIEEPSDTGCLPRGWPRVVINQKVGQLRARYVSPEMTGEDPTRMSFVSRAWNIIYDFAWNLMLTFWDSTFSIKRRYQ